MDQSTSLIRLAESYFLIRAFSFSLGRVQQRLKDLLMKICKGCHDTEHFSLCAFLRCQQQSKPHRLKPVLLGRECSKARGDCERQIFKIFAAVPPSIILRCSEFKWSSSTTCTGWS